LAEGINTFLHSLRSSLPAFRTTTLAELAKGSLSRSRSYGTIHFVRKKANTRWILYKILLPAAVTAHVCPSGSAWQNPVDRSKRHRSQPLSGACSQPEPKHPSLAFRPSVRTALFSLKTCRSDGRNNMLFFLSKEVPWSSALLLLRHGLVRQPRLESNLFLVKNSSCITGPRRPVCHPERRSVRRRR